MPNNLTDTEENRLLDLSLIDGDLVALMTTIGTDSTAGVEAVGSPYARQSVTWAAAAGGAKASDTDVTFAELPEMDIQGWAIYDSTGTDRKWHGVFSSAAATAAAATDTVTAPAHGILEGGKLVFQIPPPGLTAATTYYARDVTSSTFRVAAALAGAVIDVTADSADVVFGRVLDLDADASVVLVAGQVVCSLS